MSDKCKRCRRRDSLARPLIGLFLAESLPTKEQTRRKSTWSVGIGNWETEFFVSLTEEFSTKAEAMKVMRRLAANYRDTILREAVAELNERTGGPCYALPEIRTLESLARRLLIGLASRR